MRHILEIKDSEGAHGAQEVEISIVSSSIKFEFYNPKRIVLLNKEELKQILGMHP